MTSDAVYTSSPPVLLLPPVASPETLNVTSPRSVDGAIQSKTQEPEVVLELC